MSNVSKNTSPEQGAQSFEISGFFAQLDDKGQDLTQSFETLLAVVEQKKRPRKGDGITETAQHFVVKARNDEQISSLLDSVSDGHKFSKKFRKIIESATEENDIGREINAFMDSVEKAMAVSDQDLYASFVAAKNREAAQKQVVRVDSDVHESFVPFQDSAAASRRRPNYSPLPKPQPQSLPQPLPKPLPKRKTLAPKQAPISASAWPMFVKMTAVFLACLTLTIVIMLAPSYLQEPEPVVQPLKALPPDTTPHAVNTPEPLQPQPISQTIPDPPVQDQTVAWPDNSGELWQQLLDAYSQQSLTNKDLPMLQHLYTKYADQPEIGRLIIQNLTAIASDEAVQVLRQLIVLPQADRPVIVEILLSYNFRGAKALTLLALDQEKNADQCIRMVTPLRKSALADQEISNRLTAKFSLIPNRSLRQKIIEALAAMKVRQIPFFVSVASNSEYDTNLRTQAIEAIITAATMYPELTPDFSNLLFELRVIAVKSQDPVVEQKIHDAIRLLKQLEQKNK